MRSAQRARLELTAPAVPESVGHVRRCIDELAERAGFDRMRRADVVLAVSEACANVVVHAYDRTEADGGLTVTAAAAEGVLEVRVTDDGTGIASRPDSPGVGLGLPLMASLTSALEFHESADGGTEVLMVFDHGDPATDAGWHRTG